MSVWHFFQVNIQTGFERKDWSISNIKNNVYGRDVRRFLNNPGQLFSSRFWAVTLVKTCFCVHVALQQISVYGWDVRQFHGSLSRILSHIVCAAIVADFATRFVWMVRCRLQRKCHYSWDVSIFLQWYQPQTLFDKVAKCMFSGSAKRPS